MVGAGLVVRMVVDGDAGWGNWTVGIMAVELMDRMVRIGDAGWGSWSDGVGIGDEDTEGVSRALIEGGTVGWSTKKECVNEGTCPLIDVVENLAGTVGRGIQICDA